MLLRLLHPAATEESTLSASEGSALPWPHPTGIGALAVAPDGSAIATGSEAPRGAEPEAPVVGVTIWDVAGAAPRVTIPVEGGLSRARRRGRGLRFSSDGRLLALNHLTNAVGVIDARTGRIRASALASAREAAPSFALSTAGDRLVVGAADDTPGAWATTFSVASGGPLDRLHARDAGRSVEVLSWHDGLVHGLVSHALVALDPATGAIVRERALPATVDPDRVWCAPSGRAVVLGMEQGLAWRSIDEELAEDLPISDVTGVAFAGSAKAFGIVRGEGEHAEALVVEGSTILARVPGPFARAEGSAPEAPPLALRPDGGALAMVRPGGQLEVVRATGSFTRARLAAIEGVTAVLWPTPEVIVAIGPSVVAFLRPSGERIARYGAGG